MKRNLSLNSNKIAIAHLDNLFAQFSLYGMKMVLKWKNIGTTSERPNVFRHQSSYSDEETLCSFLRAKQQRNIFKLLDSFSSNLVHTVIRALFIPVFTIYDEITLVSRFRPPGTKSFQLQKATSYSAQAQPIDCNRFFYWRNKKGRVCERVHAATVHIQ